MKVLVCAIAWALCVNDKRFPGTAGTTEPEHSAVEIIDALLQPVRYGLEGLLEMVVDDGPSVDLERDPRIIQGEVALRLLTQVTENKQEATP